MSGVTSTKEFLMANLMDEIEAAQYLRSSRSFLRQSRVRGTGPTFIKMGRSVRYRLEDLDSWIDGKKRQNTIQLWKEA